VSAFADTRPRASQKRGSAKADRRPAAQEGWLQSAPE